jgi:PTS system nitrogen regulatory IIA component
VSEVLQNVVNTINVPQSLGRDILLNKLEEREQMAPTAIGDKIAFPHPRMPIVNTIEDECIALCFLHKPINFNAPDGQLVHVLFIILSSNQTRHLRLMSKLSHCCRQQSFIDLLNNHPLREEVYSYINKHSNF